MPPKELVDEIEKAYNEYKKEKEKEVDYLTFYNGFVACNRNRQQENNKLLDVINNQDIKIADLEKQIQEVAKDNDYYQHENITLEQLCEQKDKQIAELKQRLVFARAEFQRQYKENEELRNNGFTVSAMTEQQLKVAIEKGEQLEKENAELKEKNRQLNNEVEDLTAYCNQIGKIKTDVLKIFEHIVAR